VLPLTLTIRDDIARVCAAFIDAKVLLCLRVVMNRNSSGSGERQKPNGISGCNMLINEVRNWNALLSLAIAIFVDTQSQPVHSRLSQVLRRILFDRSDYSGSAHAFSGSLDQTVGSFSGAKTT